MIEESFGVTDGVPPPCAERHGVLTLASVASVASMYADGRETWECTECTTAYRCGCCGEGRAGVRNTSEEEMYHVTCLEAGPMIALRPANCIAGAANFTTTTAWLRFSQTPVPCSGFLYPCVSQDVVQIRSTRLGQYRNHFGS